MHISRRTCLRLGALGALGALLPTRAFAAPEPRAKRCIVLWLDGGPSHIDTFDPKPGVPTGGPFDAIATAAAGLQLSQHLPLLAKQANRMTVVRSLTSKEGEHDRASHLLRTGAIPQPTVRRPQLGAILSERRGAWKAPLPPFVALGAAPESGGSEAGFLGASHEPLALANLDQGVSELVLPESVTRDGRLDRRLALLRLLDGSLGQRVTAAEVKAASDARDAALKLLTGETAGAFDLEREPAAARALYGDSQFGRGCLLARRLVERGTRFVEVRLDGWDTHENNFKQLSDELLPDLDRGLAALLEDLNGSGLLQDTLVVCMGEFGRTPEINENGGRDHHPDVFSAVLAGAGVPGGFVLGKSDAEGRAVAERPVAPKDLVAWTLQRLGVDPATSYTTPEGRPITLVEGWKPIPELS